MMQHQEVHSFVGQFLHQWKMDLKQTYMYLAVMYKHISTYRLGWDMLYKQDAPLITKEVAHQTPLHCLSMHEQGCLLCVGRDDGAVALLELSDSLSTSTKVLYNIQPL